MYAGYIISSAILSLISINVVTLGKAFFTLDLIVIQQSYSEKLNIIIAKAPVTVIVNQHNDVTEWLLPNYLSQSTIGGRMTGSNACTVIALLTGRHFLEGALAIPKELKDLDQTIPFYCQ